MKQRERNDFIDRHNFCITKSGREPAAKIVEGGLKPFARGTGIVHDDRRVMGHSAVTGGPGAIRLGLGDGAWEQAKLASWFRGEHLKLDAAFRARGRVEAAAGDEFTTG